MSNVNWINELLGLFWNEETTAWITLVRCVLSKDKGKDFYIHHCIMYLCTAMVTLAMGRQNNIHVDCVQVLNIVFMLFVMLVVVQCIHLYTVYLILNLTFVNFRTLNTCLKPFKITKLFCYEAIRFVKSLKLTW